MKESAGSISLQIHSDASLDADGVVHGWCWCPDRPSERMTVEIYVNQELVATIVASRFGDDLRNRGIGDGYHGFMATITRALRESGDQAVVSACDRLTGRIFWRRAVSARGARLPHSLAERIATLSGLSRECAQSATMTPSGHLSCSASFRTELARVGRMLVSRAQPMSSSDAQ